VTTLEQMHSRLAALSPQTIEVRDDSALHAGHAGARSGGGHFQLTIVSDVFKGQPTLARHRILARHRMVYEALGDMMKNRIHALAIQALTADEAETQPKSKEH